MRAPLPQESPHPWGGALKTKVVYFSSFFKTRDHIWWSSFVWFCINWKKVVLQTNFTLFSFEDCKTMCCAPCPWQGGGRKARGREAVHNKVQYTGRLRPVVQPLIRLHTIRYLFLPFIDKWYPFHIPSLDNFRRQIEFCKADCTRWKLTLQDIKMTPIEPKTDWGWSRRQCYSQLLWLTRTAQQQK